jgi:hypothetical protein
MRMMLKVTVPTDVGNRAMKDGTLQRVLNATMTKLNPEAAYFVANEGRRCAMLFFEMHHASDIPAIAEPLFSELGAEIEIVPVMNAEDLEKGLSALTVKSKGRRNR